MTRVCCTGDKKMLNRITDSSPLYTTTLRASSAANIRIAGASMPCVFLLQPLRVSNSACFTLLSNNIKAKVQGTCSWQGAPPFFRHPPSAVDAKDRNTEALSYQASTIGLDSGMTRS